MTALSEALTLLRTAHGGLAMAERALRDASRVLSGSYEGEDSAQHVDETTDLRIRIEALFGRVALAIPPPPPGPPPTKDDEARSEAALPPADLPCPVCRVRGRHRMSCVRGSSESLRLSVAIAPDRGAP